ncbi:MAG: apolipoprotein N-acyltransferase [Balneolaceae bacterium]|nr:apolipoprotein N-acyltransferase [Balneolaceae bacterium]
MKAFFDNKWAVSITAGILLGCSFPPVNLTFLSFPAFILLFYLANQCNSYKQTTYYSYAGFVVWNTITTYWLMMASLPAGIAAILANSMLMTIPLSLAKYFEDKAASPLLIAFLQTSAWVTYEFLHHHWDLSWPWLAIGNAWSNSISLIQYISVTGHLGITFWVLLTSAIAWQALKHRQKQLAYIGIGVFLLFPLLSLVSFDQDHSADNQGKVEIAIVQPNHDSYQDFGGMSGIDEVLDSLFVLAEQVRTPKTNLIIWPENAIDGVIRMNSYSSQRVADSARAWNTSFLIGTSFLKTYPKDTQELYTGLYQGKPYTIFNAALYVYPDGRKEVYKKAKLVPIVERLPFVNFFNTIDLFDWVDWGSIQQFGKGQRANNITSEALVTSGLVCYDSVYPSWVREFVLNEASFITIITNDGWWGDTSGHHQHFAYARLRAIEFDRWIARSANNGISGIIAPNGVVIEKTAYWTRTAFTYNIPNKTKLTFYARFGNWLPQLCMLTAFLFFGRYQWKHRFSTSDYLNSK